jgi:hypothetical protein
MISSADVRRITITDDRVCYGCGCWRDLRGRLRDPEGRQGERRRGHGCHRMVHKRLSVWPKGRIPYRRDGES